MILTHTNGHLYFFRNSMNLEKTDVTCIVILNLDHTESSKALAHEEVGLYHTDKKAS